MVQSRLQRIIVISTRLVKFAAFTFKFCFGTEFSNLFYFTWSTFKIEFTWFPNNQTRTSHGWVLLVIPGLDVSSMTLQTYVKRVMFCGPRGAFASTPGY